MRRFRHNVLSTHNLSKLIILLVITVLLPSSACTPSPEPPPTPSPPPNQSPVIDSLTAEKEVTTSSESQIVCKADDPDGDMLTYQWSADGGTIKGEGSSVAWVAPDTAGNYTIELTVADGKGGTVSQSITIAAISKPNQPPVISGLTIDGSLAGEENRVRQWTTKTIHCDAQDPDGNQLTYLWRATGGKVTGIGDTVGWTSPGVNGDYTVTVVVYDNRDGSAEASVVFKVICCGGGF